ncbi:Armadillo repeat-containing protein 7 [Desmophyllum pertusum]|uniref:Armadillo repeat-containing protein 7 n=1 Tax=Desmophyllum pertusum TaxID=174260 RepID=A0A9W9Z7T8_9CNID|nr:Armadillo repeat-containing protein 7 [Desmophyllum pertusum]
MTASVTGLCVTTIFSVLGAKEEILANLANFAYDPINFEHFRKLNVVDLFLDMLTEENEKFIEFGIGGLSNCSLDKENKQHIINNGVLMRQTVLSAITTLMFLTTPQTQQEITSEPVVDCMERFSTSSNARLSNLAKVFLQDLLAEEFSYPLEKRAQDHKHTKTIRVKPASDYA